MAEVFSLLVAFALSIGVRVEAVPRLSTLDGTLGDYEPGARLIRIDDALTPRGRTYVLLHEIAHRLDRETAAVPPHDPVALRKWIETREHFADATVNLVWRHRFKEPPPNGAGLAFEDGNNGAYLCLIGIVDGFARPSACDVVRPHPMSRDSRPVRVRVGDY